MPMALLAALPASSIISVNVELSDTVVDHVWTAFWSVSTLIDSPTPLK